MPSEYVIRFKYFQTACQKICYNHNTLFHFKLFRAVVHFDFSNYSLFLSILRDILNSSVRAVYRLQLHPCSSQETKFIQYSESDT